MKPKEKQKHLEGRHFIKPARMSRGPCNIQEDTPQHQTSVEAPARNQAAEKSIDFSKPFICVFSPPKHPCLDKDGRRISQDNVEQPESPVEAPACSQAAGEKTAFSQHPIGVSTPSKRTRLYEDVFDQPHQKVFCTGPSEMPVFQPVRKQKSTEWHSQAKLNSGDALQHRQKAMALTQRQKAWKASSSESFASISSKVKQNDAGRRISQDNVAQPESPVEAPACSQAAGEKTAFSLHPIGVSTPSKRTRLYEDVFDQPHQKVFCTGPSEMPVFQPVRKQKSTEWHSQAKLNSGDALQHRQKAMALTQRQKAWKASSSESFASISSKVKQNDAGRRISQDNVAQPESPVEAPACSQAAGEKTAFSLHPIGVSTPSKRTRLYEDVFDQPHQKVFCTGPSEMPVFQPVWKHKSTERHIQAKLNSGDALQHRQKAMALTQRQKAWKASSSESFASISSKVKQNDPGRRISQDNVAQFESPVEAPACNQAAGEKTTFSQHPIGVSTPSKRTRLYEDEIKEMPVSQDSEQTENSSDYSHPYIPSHVPNNNEPFMSSVHGTDVRPMKIYYMHVQLKRGVAVLYHTKEGWEPPSKKIKIEEMTYIGKVHKNVPVYHMSEKKHLIAHEPMLDSGAQEKREEADSPAQPPALGGYPSAKTPEWLVALDSGFRCMACCRVFPSLKILQDHVEYGVREGFSCHVFHNAMAHLKFKACIRRKKEKEEKALFRR